MMRIALLQERQNKLYDFSEKFCLSPEKAGRLQIEMIDQNIMLMEKAAAHCDFAVTSEAINYPGDLRVLGQKGYDIIHKTYDKTVNHFSLIAKKFGIFAAVCLYRPDAHGVIYNSILYFDTRGVITTIYDKIHLAGSEKETLCAGSTFCYADTLFGRIGLCICWDMQFPETSRILAIKGTDLIICPTWGWESIYTNAHAYENGIFIAGAMAVPYEGQISGIRTPSNIIKPDGMVLVQSSYDRAEVLFADFDPKESRPYRELRLNDRRPEVYESANN